MPTSEIYAFFILGVIVIALLRLIFVILRMADEKQLTSLLGSSLKDRIIQLLIIGTDADLKIELFFFVYILAIVTLDSWLNFEGGGSLSGILVLLAVLQGYHFRHWLSRWRFRNIVNVNILTRESILYPSEIEDIAALIVNNLIMFWLIFLDPTYSLFQVGGFLAHEIFTEVQKRHMLIKRKIHLFDLDAIEDERLRNKLFRCVQRFQLKTIQKLADQAPDLKTRILLKAFYSLLRNQLARLDELFETNRRFIEGDRHLVYYFGKAYYNLGVLERAESLLSHGYESFKDISCLAYHSLCVLARDRGLPAVNQVIERMEANMPEKLVDKNHMFLAAIHALALSISTGREGVSPPNALRKALFSIHEAMRINQLVFEGRHLRETRRIYFEANNQMFIDIYGYIVFRQGNVQLCFRLLESVIRADNTYPWPYFHLALIYQKLGKTSLARSIYYRIAVNETAESVIKGQCLRRLKILSEDEPTRS